jgi:hypothetical protein
VTKARNNTELLKSQVESLGLELEREKQQDRLHEREAEKAQRQAQAQAEKRRKQAEAEAEEERRQWHSQWMRFAMDRIGRIAPDAPPEIHQQAIDAAEETLDELGPSDSEKETRYKMELTVDGAVRVWQRRKDAHKAIESALERLPQVQRPEMDGLREQAQRAVTQAIAELDEHAARREMEMAAARATRPMQEKMQHIERCYKCADGIFLSEATLEEQRQAVREIRAVLLRAPMDSSDFEMRSARDSEAALIRREIQARRAREKAEETQESVLKAAAFIHGLPADSWKRVQGEIRADFAKLPPDASWAQMKQARDARIRRHQAGRKRGEAKDGLIEAARKRLRSELERMKWRFDGQPVWRVEQEIWPAVCDALELELTGDESPEEASQLMRRIMRREIGVQ